MVAPVISILSDLSEESVGSHKPHGDSLCAIPAIIYYNLDYSSFSDSDPLEDSLPPAPDLPLVLPFLCSDDSKADVRPIPTRKLAWRRVSHHSSDRRSSPDSSSSSSPSDHSLSGHTPPDTTDADSSTP
ncbi:hypothetical protein Tco_0000142 [Tanacetum coccineum]